MNEKPITAYSTIHELQFLRHLGAWSKTSRMSREELLSRYIDAAEIRDRWGFIDKRIVLEDARKMLEGMK